MNDPRHILAHILLVFAGILSAAAVAFWLGWLPVEPAMRPYLVIALLAAAGADTFMALRFFATP